MSRSEFLSFSPPYLGQEEIDEVLDTLRSGWITTGPKARRFEEEFAAYVGAPAAVGVSSGTAAMQVALTAMGVGPGDAVITTPMTFCSTVHVIEQVGASPVLVDVDRSSLNIDPDRVDQVLGTRDDIAALLPVHMAGQVCDLDSLYELAGRNDSFVVEDAAHALPARHGGSMVGAIRGGLPGHAVCFSFYATKNLTTGEGGMITSTPELSDLMRTWSLHGMSRDALDRYEEGGSWFYEVTHPGLKANLTDVQAAIGLQQLKRLDWMHSRRTEVADAYTKAFDGVTQVETPLVSGGTTHAWHLYVLRLHLDQLSLDRNRFIAELSRRNIGTSVHFIPIHLHPYYRDKYGYKPEDFPIAHAEYLRSVSLPLHPGLTDQDVQDVIEAVMDVVATHTS